MLTLHRLNELSEPECRDVLFRCCGARRWVDALLYRRPFQDVNRLLAAAEDVWFALSPDDWHEAFAQHPQIGDLEQLRERFSTTASFSEQEQGAAVEQASEAALQALATGNEHYKERFGYIFIVCATGKSVEEMLSILSSRLANDPDTELLIAATEQHKITRLRLEKLLAGGTASSTREM